MKATGSKLINIQETENFYNGRKKFNIFYDTERVMYCLFINDVLIYENTDVEKVWDLYKEMDA